MIALRMAMAMAALCLAVSCGDETARTITPALPKPPTHAGELMSADEAIHSAEIARIDPVTLTEAELRSFLGAGPLCRFRYTRASPPVLGFQAPIEATSEPVGLVKLNGRLVLVQVARIDSGAVRLAADGLTLAITTGDAAVPGQMQTSDLVLTLEAGFRAGYRGAYACDP